MLIAEFSVGQVGAYQLDANGNPLVATRRPFLEGLSGAERHTVQGVTSPILLLPKLAPAGRTWAGDGAPGYVCAHSP